MEEALGCTSKQTATEQKETFNGIIKNALGSDEKKSNHFFMEIQESLNNKIEEHKYGEMLLKRFIEIADEYNK